MNELNELEFFASFLPGETRCLTRTGVEIHCLLYWSDALTPWVGQKLKAHVHYDPRDITFVYVRTPGGSLVRALVTTPEIKPISLAEWQARRHAERAVARHPDVVAKRDASMCRSNAIVAEARAKRRVRRRRATEAAGDKFRGTPATLAAPSEAPAATAPLMTLADFQPEPYEIEGDSDEIFY